MQVAQFAYDFGLERGREPQRDDLVRMIQLGEALHGEAGVGHALLMRDVPSPLEPLEAQRLLIQHASKPQSAYHYYSGRVLSPEQLLVEQDVGASVRRLSAPIEVSEQTLAQESILDVGQGIGKTHLMTDHTLQNHREALWSPTFHDLVPRPDCRADFAHDRRVVEQAHAQHLGLLSRYRAPAVDPCILQSVLTVVEHARAAMSAWDLG